MGNDSSKTKRPKDLKVETIFDHPSETTRRYAEKSLSAVFAFAAKDVKTVVRLSQVNQTFSELVKKPDSTLLDDMWKALTHDATPAAIHKVPSCRLKHTEFSAQKTLKSADPYQNSSPKQQQQQSVEPTFQLEEAEFDKSSGIGGVSLTAEPVRVTRTSSKLSEDVVAYCETEDAPEETESRAGKLIGEDFIKLCNKTQRTPSLIWIIEKMIYRGKIDLNYKSLKTMNTALITAVEAGNVGIVPTLVTAGARVNKRGIHGKTPLLVACERGDVMLAKFLLKFGADPLAHDALGTTCLQAAMINDLTGELLDALLESKKFDIDGSLSNLSAQTKGKPSENNEGLGFGRGPPLLEACRRGVSLENIKVLLKHGADVNVHAKSNHVSALLTAVKNGRSDIAKLLIEHGADVNTVTAASSNGTTPLMAACVTGDLESCKLLVEKGKAHLNVRDNNGNSAIMLAKRHECPEIVAYLQSKGATE